MKTSKTMVVMDSYTPTYVNNTQIVNVDNYSHMGPRYNARDKHLHEEIRTIITAECKAFANRRDIVKSNSRAY